MRRLVLLPLIALLACALVACGGSKTPQGEAPGSGSTSLFTLSAAGDPPADASASARPVPTLAPSNGLTIQNLDYKKDTNGSVTFTAQVVNLGAEQASIAKVVVDLYDASGQRVTRVSFSGLSLPVLQPGEGASWQGQRADLGTTWTEVRASAIADQASASR